MNRRRQQARLTKFENGLKGKGGGGHKILLKLSWWRKIPRVHALNGGSGKKTEL